MESSTRIDAATGCIEFRGGTLSSRSPREEFERLVASVSNPPWVTYDLRLDDLFLASVAFIESKLCEIRLMRTTRDESGSPWTKQAERRRRLDRDSWLEI